MKLIIDIPDNVYDAIKKAQTIISGQRSGKTFLQILVNSVENGTPLDNNSERAEVQAYFDGQAYGWEQGRKALIDDVKAEIEEKISHYDHFSSSNTAHGLSMALAIIDKYISGKENNADIKADM